MSEAAREFKLWENSPDPGAWVLYGTRYSTEQLSLKQKQLIAVLEERVVFRDEWDSIWISRKEGVPVESSTMFLLEELACVNEAIDLHANQPDLAGKWLTRVLEHNPILEITRESASRGNLPILYNSIDLGWGQVLRDIGIAERQNGVLTSRQRRLFELMCGNKDRAITLLQGRHVLIGF